MNAFLPFVLQKGKEALYMQMLLILAVLAFQIPAFYRALHMKVLPFS